MGMISGNPIVKVNGDIVKETRQTILWGPVLYEPTITYEKGIERVVIEVKTGKQASKDEDPRSKGFIRCRATEKRRGGMAAKVMKNVKQGDFVVIFGNLHMDGVQKKQKVYTMLTVDAIFPMSMMSGLSDVLTSGQFHIEESEGLEEDEE